MRRLVAALVLVLIAPAAQKAAAETVFAEVTINGYKTGLIVSFDQQGDRFISTAGDLGRIGLVVPKSASKHPDAPIDLGSLSGVHFVFHADRQALDIEAEEGALRRNVLGYQASVELPDPAAWGTLVNYGAAFTAASTGTPEISGNFEFRGFGPPGILDSNWYFGPVADGETQFRRLDTALIHDDAGSLETWTAGDFISASLPWTRPVRGVGFSLATNFTIRPDLITQPMPWLQGTASVPSTVDLYLNGVHQLSEETPPGPFSVNQIPLVNGEGQVSLAVSDALGRQTVQSFSFYATDQLLAPDLMSYAIEGGWLRENFGQENDHYTEPFGQGLVSRGMTNWLTLEGRLAGTRGVMEIGAGLVAKLAEFAVLELSLDDSSFSGRDGRQLRASIERQAGPYFLFVSAQQSFGDFRDVASAAGDAPIQSGFQAGLGWNSTNLGTFGLDYFQQKTANGDFRMASDDPQFDDIGIVTASWSLPFGRGWTAYASAYRSVAGTSSFGFMVGVTMSPANGLIVDGGVGESGDHVGAFADASQSPPTDGGWGWSAQAQSAPEPSGQGNVRYISQIGEAGAGVSTGSAGTLGTAYVTGSVVWLAGGNPRLARQSGASFAEVDAGEPGVGITLENRDMGKTGSDGRLLVPDVISFTPNHFAIEPDTVPLSHEIVQASAVVRPPRNAGVIVSLPVRPSRSAAVRFVTADGSSVAFNAPVTLNGQEAGNVGYDGVAWLSDLVADNRVRIGESDQACTAEFQLAPSAFKPGVQIGPVVCK